VSYSTTAGTAGSDDFASSSGILTFVDGESSKTVLVPLTDDVLLEAAETFTLTLSSVSGAILGTDSTTTVTIADDDDTDGDGFSDDVETAFGSNPADATSTPFEGAGPGTAKSFKSPKAQITLDFKRTNRDEITFSAVLPLAKSFKPKGQRIVLDVGGVVAGATLSKSGKGSGGGAKFTLTPGNRKLLTVKFSKGDFEAAFADEGLTNQDATKAAKTVVVNLYLDGSLYTLTKAGQYTAKLDEKGQFK
jgi:hypothetical protein